MPKTEGWIITPTTSVHISDYARQHPDHYGLRPIVWMGGKVIEVELVLMDREWDPIDEAGCNCDLDSPCNNPKCVMDCEKWPWGWSG